MVRDTVEGSRLNLNIFDFCKIDRAEVSILLKLVIISSIIVFIKILFFKTSWNHETCILYSISEDLSEGKWYNFQSIIPSYKFLSNMSFIILNALLYKILNSFFLSSIFLSILITSIILVVNYTFLKKLFDFETALISSILFIGMGWGFGFISKPWIYLTDFFCFLTLVMSYRLYLGTKRWQTYFILGILSGISFSFHPLAVFALGISLIVQIRGFKLKKFGIFLLAFFLIFLPFMLYTDIEGFYLSFIKPERERLIYDVGWFSKEGIIKISNIVPELLSFSPFFLISFLYLSLENFTKFIKKGEIGREYLILIYCGAIFLFGLVTYLKYSKFMVFLIIPTSILVSVFLKRIINKNRKWGAILSVIFILLVFLYDLKSFQFENSSIIESYKGCYDILGYSIAKISQGDINAIKNDCERLEENKYYCYRGFGKVLGQKFISSEYDGFLECKKIKFSEWCEEGLIEEFSFHRLRNLSLENEFDIYRYSTLDGWSLINFGIEKPRKVLGEKSREVLSDLKINFTACEDFIEPDICYENLPWLYSVIRKKTNPNIPEEFISIKKCDALKESSRISCYIGWFKKIDVEKFPYVTSLDTCRLLDGECKHACYLSIGLKVAYRHPNTKISEMICESLGEDDNVFKSFCYSAIGVSEANKFYYNISKASEGCNEMRIGKNSCIKGISYFTKNYTYSQILEDLTGGKHLEECRIKGTILVEEAKNINISNCSLYYDGTEPHSIEPPWNVGIQISNSKGITLENCNINNFTINVLIKDSEDILIKNTSLSNGYFRNLHVVCVKNLTIDNSNFYDAWNDQSIDLSVCENKNIMIANSTIFNSNRGIRLENTRNVVIENNKISDCRIGIKIDDNVHNVSIKNNNLQNFEEDCISVNESLSTIYLENNVIKNCENTYIQSTPLTR